MTRLLLIFSALTLWQCARQSQPGGGPKDIAPPQLLSATPEDGQKNFKGKTIELTFDELIKLKDPQEEIVITPSIGTKTKFLAKKNKLIITPEKTWKDSTTYSIAFRGSVQDINESNPSEDLHLAFSTGSTIDSLSLHGSVSEAFKEKIPEKITVALYQSDTFDIFLHKPIYFTKTDKAGHFSIRNLKAGNYFVYAFEDKNKNFKADSKSEKFGFSNTRITLPSAKDSVNINLIRIDARPIKVTSIRNTSTVSTIRFNKLLDSVLLKTDNSPLIYTYGDTRSEVIVYKDFDKRDSLAIKLSAYDSAQQMLDTTVYVKYEDTKKIEETFKLSEWQTDFQIQTKIATATAQSNKLLLSLNYDSMYFQIDTANFSQLTPKDIRIDTLKKTITLSKELKIEVKPTTPNPVLLFGKSAFISIDNDSSKSQDLKITIPKIKETGSLSIEINTSEKHFTLQLLTSTGKLIKSIRDLKKYTFGFLAPAEYKILIIIDTNNNLRWDAGNYYKKVEPERVILYHNAENKYSFPIRANWEVGPLVINF